MNRIIEPVQVMPPVYELPMNLWRWCKIGEICEVAASLGKITGNSFAPTPEELIHSFAALVRPNKLPPDQGKRKKLFRYTLDGLKLMTKEVPVGVSRLVPPYDPFALDIDPPYPKEMFVPEGWVIDTLKAIRLGAIAAADWDSRLVGFPQKKEGNIITLKAKKGAI